MAVEFRVRSGKGTVTGTTFNDIVETVTRTPIKTVRRDRVIYKGKRYQLMGGIRTDYFICLNNPITK